METETISDNNHCMMRNQTTSTMDALEEQCGLGFIARIYRTTLLVWMVTALIVGDRFGLAAIVGLSMGTALAAGSLWVIELTVRVLLRPEVQIEARRFMVILFLKLPLLTTLMVGVVWTVMAGYANVFSFVGGIALVHAVIVLKAVGGWMVAGLSPEPRLTIREAWVPRVSAVPLSRAWRAPVGQREGAEAAVLGRADRSAPASPIWSERSPMAQPATD
jgi:hypothetical protein